MIDVIEVEMNADRKRERLQRRNAPAQNANRQPIRWHIGQVMIKAGILAAGAEQRLIKELETAHEQRQLPVH